MALPLPGPVSPGLGPKCPEFQLGLFCFPRAARPRSHSVGEDAARLLGRFEALRRLRHPGLGRYLDALIGRDHHIFVAAEHSSRVLADALRDNPQGLDEQFAVKMVRQLVDALVYLNGQGLVHGHLEAKAVLFSESGGVKLTGHGLGHLVWHGRLADFPLCARGAHLAPELAPGPRSGGSGARPCSKPDVWGLGVLLLEALHGEWRPDLGPAAAHAAGCSARADDEVRVMREAVILQTAFALKRFAEAASNGARALSTAALLGGSAAAELAKAEADGIALPLPTEVPPNADPILCHAEDLYRQWLSGRSSSRGAQELRNLWEVCLTAHPAFRPSPADVASHPALAAAKGKDSQGSGDLRWTDCPALQCERVPPPHQFEACTPPSSPLQYLVDLGADVEHVYYWWNLAGGDAFEVLVERGMLRPVPPIFRLPLYVRDRGADDQRGAAVGFLSSRAEGGAQTHELDEDVYGTCHHGLWGPPGTVQPRMAGVDLRPLCSAVAAAERAAAGEVPAEQMRPASLYERQHHFTYQWLRFRQFGRLLLGLPSSRPELFREAADDIPPLLRPRAWAAILGSDADSDRFCWTPFYEQLLASPMEPGLDSRKRQAMQALPCHELFGHPEGRRRLERLVHALLQANPALGRVDGLGAVAAPMAALYADNEVAAFLALQRLLHGFLWQLYSEEGPRCRGQSMQLFGALLGFADPQLALHLQEMGMPPDAYASEWFPSWFALAFPMAQLVLLWDALLLRGPQFSLFVAVCLMHSFRQALLITDEASNVSSFLASCAQLVDVPFLVQASTALFQAVPASVTLPLYPRHSAGEALLSHCGPAAVAAVDRDWSEGLQQDMGVRSAAPTQSGRFKMKEDYEVAAREHLAQRSLEQWRMCGWWWRRAASSLTPPIITVDDLISFRSSCFILDVRTHDEYIEGHFQGSSFVRDPCDGELRHILPPDVLSLGTTPTAVPVVGAELPAAGSQPGTSSGGGSDAEELTEVVAPWLFDFLPSCDSPPGLRIRLVVVVAQPADCGAPFAERLVRAGVRHVVCLLGGAASLRADARAYLATGVD